MGLHVDRHLYPAEIMKCANVIISFMFFSRPNRFFSRKYIDDSSQILKYLLIWEGKKAAIRTVHGAKPRETGLH